MIRNYIKLALKVLARRKFFTFISLFGISLTLVVLMLATAILDNLFAPRAPESRFDRVLGVYSMGLYGERGGRTGPPGYGFLDKYLRGLPGAENVSIFSQLATTVLYHDGQKIESYVKRTDGPYWQILDFNFVEGGPFTQADDDAGRFVAVISEGMRTKLFGPHATAVGRVFEVDGFHVRIVGVVRDVPFTRYAGFSEIWLPTHTTKMENFRRSMTGAFHGIVLARSSSDFEKLRGAFADRVAKFHFDDPKMYNKLVVGLDTTFEGLARLMTNNKLDRKAATVLRTIFLGIALLFITLPTLNLVTINLSRIMERASEIGVRKAFGASSRSLVGQFIVENIVLTIIGGTIGFVLSVIALWTLNRAGWIPHASFDVNFRIFLWGMVIAALFGLISGVYPAWKMSRLHPVNALRGGAV
jgi:putative ABC transport system permease protein